MATQHPDNRGTVDLLLAEAEASYAITRSTCGMSDIFGIACQSGLLGYLKRIVKSREDLAVSSTERWTPPALWNALKPHRLLGRVFPDIIKYLLQCGADPNEFYHGSSPFIHFIEILNDAGKFKDLAALVQTLLEHGADLEAINLHSHPTIPVRSVLKKCFEMRTYSEIIRQFLGTIASSDTHQEELNFIRMRFTPGTPSYEPHDSEGLDRLFQLQANDFGRLIIMIPNSSYHFRH